MVTHQENLRKQNSTLVQLKGRVEYESASMNARLALRNPAYSLRAKFDVCPLESTVP